MTETSQQVAQLPFTEAAGQTPPPPRSVNEALLKMNLQVAQGMISTEPVAAPAAPRYPDFWPSLAQK